MRFQKQIGRNIELETTNTCIRETINKVKIIKCLAINLNKKILREYLILLEKVIDHLKTESLKLILSKFTIGLTIKTWLWEQTKPKGTSLGIQCNLKRKTIWLNYYMLNWWLASVKIDWSHQKKKLFFRKAQKRLWQFGIGKALHLKLVIKIRKETIVMWTILLGRVIKRKRRKRCIVKRFPQLEK